MYVKLENSDTIAHWAEETFGPATALSTAIRALDELRELISLLGQISERRDRIGKYNAKAITPEDIANLVMSEVADVRIVLARIQTFFPGAPSAEKAEDEKMKINRARRWAIDGNGHGQHIEEKPL